MGVPPLPPRAGGCRSGAGCCVAGGGGPSCRQNRLLSRLLPSRKHFPPHCPHHSPGVTSMGIQGHGGSPGSLRGCGLGKVSPQGVLLFKGEVSGMSGPLVGRSSSDVQNLPCRSWCKPALRPTTSDPTARSVTWRAAPSAPAAGTLTASALPVQTRPRTDFGASPRVWGVAEVTGSPRLRGQIGSERRKLEGTCCRGSEPGVPVSGGRPWGPTPQSHPCPAPGEEPGCASPRETRTVPRTPCPMPALTGILSPPG